MLRNLVLSSLLLAAGATAASELFLFEFPDYGGRQFAAIASSPNLDNGNFPDRAASARIRSGQWQFCSDFDFRGRCVTLGPGDYPTPVAMGLPSGVSSIRDLSPQVQPLPFQPQQQQQYQPPPQQQYQPPQYPPSGGSGVRPAPGGGYPTAGARAILYQGPNLSGRTFVVDRYIANLGDTGFNDRAQSLRVEGGYWMFCSDASFNGECRTFGPGDYPTLPSELRSRISSGRKVSDGYPYRGNPDWGR